MRNAKSNFKKSLAAWGRVQKISFEETHMPPHKWLLISRYSSLLYIIVLTKSPRAQHSCAGDTQLGPSPDFSRTSSVRRLARLSELPWQLPWQLPCQRRPGPRLAPP